MCINLSTERWIETYYGCKERDGMTFHEAYDEMVTSTVAMTAVLHSLLACYVSVDELDPQSRAGGCLHPVLGTTVY